MKTDDLYVCTVRNSEGQTFDISMNAEWINEMPEEQVIDRLRKTADILRALLATAEILGSLPQVTEH